VSNLPSRSVDLLSVASKLYQGGFSQVITEKSNRASLDSQLSLDARISKNFSTRLVSKGLFQLEATRARNDNAQAELNSVYGSFSAQARFKIASKLTFFRQMKKFNKTPKPQNLGVQQLP
jgi:hypothetical protein